MKQPPLSRRHHRAAFTLVELLIVIGIMILLTTVTIMSVNLSNDADRVRAGARQLQSLIAGARDRAIHAKDLRGVRLIRDPNDNHAVNAFQYVGAPAKFSVGTVNILTKKAVATADGRQVQGPGNFITFKNQGLIKVGSRIEIPKGTGRWYTIAGFPTSIPGFTQLQQDFILLSEPYAGFGSPSGAGDSNLTYELELQPQPLPDSIPVQLPKGVVVDLDGSQLPPNWRPRVFQGGYSNQMDIMFSAKGLPTGDVVSSGFGMIHFHMADVGDVVTWKQIAGRTSGNYFGTAVVPADVPGAKAVVKRSRILVSVATRSGNITVAPVNVATTAGIPVAVDPFLYAETGGVANK